MNWGYKIMLVYLIFISVMVFMAFKSSEQNIELVTEDYYAKELKFQEQVDKQKRTHELKEQLSWNVDGKKIDIQFPTEMLSKNVKAEILFYNASEAKRDFTVACSPDSNGLCQVNSAKLQHGVYEMKIDWSAGGVNYYNEGTINIQ